MLIGDAWHAGGPPMPLPPGVVHVAPSPSGSRLAVLKHDEGGPGAPSPPPPPAAPGAKARVCVELWDVPSGALLRAVTSPEGLHSAPIADGGFFSEGLSWSACERFVAFVAESVAPHVGVLSACAALSPNAPPETGGGGGGGGERAPRGRASEWGAGGREDYGEKYVGVRAPRPYVVDFERGVLCGVAGIDGRLAVGQPVFAPPGASDGAAPALALAFAGWAADGPRRLGLIHCFNRPVALYLADLSALLAAPAAPAAPAGGGGEGGGAPAPAPAPPPPVLCLTPGLRSARSPRFSPTGAHLAFLSSAGAALLTHSGASELRLLDWPAAAAWAAAAWAAPCPSPPPPPPPASTLLLPTVGNPWEPLGAPPGGDAAMAAMRSPAWWPGLYAGSLPAAPWAPDGSRLYFNTQARFFARVGSVSVGSGGADRRWEDGALGAWWGQHALAETAEPPPSAQFWGATPDGALLLSASSMTRAENALLVRDGAIGALFAAPYLGGGAGPALPACGVSGGGGLRAGRECVAEELSALRARVFAVHPPAGSSAPGGGAFPFEASLLWSSKAASEADARASGGLPLLLVPHGGPHAAFTTGWSPHHAFLAAQGVAVLAVNFRGSTGYGEEALASLPGRVGAADVADCMAALGAALARPADGAPLLDAARVAVSGGSHGGFLAAHLVGQAATRTAFRAAVLRNPVTDISAMAGATDIPDWCWTEALGVAAGEPPPALTPAHLAAMHACSPMAHVANVRVCGDGGHHATPVLLMLGMKDRRVPPSQGLAWWHALRAVCWGAGGAGERGVPDTHARMLIFPEDTHALDAPATEADAWVHIALWLAAHLGERAPAGAAIEA